ncbi:MAG: 3-deoxy-7-phosphoheptulonate synthase, partial [Planctomycetia bacterium]
VWRDVLAQRVAGDRSIVGLMMESNIHPGSQPFKSDRTQLQYGVSVTDGCIGWEETEQLLLEAHARLA